jgi:hypothetical protein
VTTDFRPPLGLLFTGPLSAAATVTPPGGAPISTRVIVDAADFTTYPPTAAQAIGFSAREISVRRDHVATVKSDTRVVVSEGADAGTYAVDVVIDEDAEIVVTLARRVA